MNIKEKITTCFMDNKEGIILFGYGVIMAACGYIIGQTIGESHGVSRASRYYTQMAIMANRGR